MTFDIDPERLEGHTLDEILQQAAAWRNYVSNCEAAPVKFVTGTRFEIDDVLDRHLPEPPRTVRDDVLQEARKITAADRNSAYGKPEDNFQNIADVWNAQGYVRQFQSDDPCGYYTQDLTATDVALMMAGMKLARLKHNPTHRDSWVDMAGYAACGYEVAERSKAEGK